MKEYLLCIVIALACAHCTRAMHPSDPGRIVLIGVPKTGSSYLHLNMQYMLEERFDYSGGRWPDDIHRRRVVSSTGASTLTFDHTCLWHTSAPRTAYMVAKRYQRKFDSADKVVVLVRDELQVLQSAYDYFGWENLRAERHLSDEEWYQVVKEGYMAINACYAPFKSLLVRQPGLLGRKIMLVHFDEMVADCDDTLNRIAHFLFGTSSQGYRCRGAGDSKRSRIPSDRSDRKRYEDHEGKLHALHRAMRVDWTDALDQQEPVNV